MTLGWQDKLGVARLYASSKWPWLHTAIYSLIPIEEPGLGTLGVTKEGVLMVDPEIVDVWSREELAAVLIHEVEHVLKDHHIRRQNAGAETDVNAWNHATDCEINDDLEAAGWQLPGKPCLPSNYDLPNGELAETYFVKIRHDERKKGCKAPCAGSGWCGSGGGKPLPNEPKAVADAKGGQSQAALAGIRSETAQAIKEASNARGDVPASWTRWADQVLKPPKVNWAKQLSKAIRSGVSRTAGAVNTSYYKPSRRQAGIGYGNGKPVLPAYYAPKPLIAVIVDTSGSMGGDELLRAASETEAIIKTTSAGIMFMAIDCEIKDPIKKVSSVKELASLLKGGGGTSFVPAFEALAKLPQQNKPNIAVYITDGMGPAPDKPVPGIDTIWLLIGPYKQKPYTVSNRSKKISWGTFIKIDD